MRCPCKGCEQRYEACWSSCENYTEWRGVFDANKKDYERQYAPENYLNDQIQKRIKRFNKRK